jgi:hypothetical protein
MSSVVISGNTSGTITLDAPAVAGTTTLTLPATSGTIVTTTSGAITSAQLPAGSVIQVNSVAKANTFSTSSTSFTDITGLSVTITPTSSSNQILILVGVTGIGTDVAGAGQTGYVLLRGSTVITAGDGGASQFTGQLSNRNLGGTAHTLNHAISYVDTPATTSATTYKIQGRAAAGTLYINRDPDDNRSISTITVMEIKG